VLYSILCGQDGLEEHLAEKPTSKYPKSGFISCKLVLASNSFDLEEEVLPCPMTLTAASAAATTQSREDSGEAESGEGVGGGSTDAAGEPTITPRGRPECR